MRAYVTGAGAGMRAQHTGKGAGWFGIISPFCIEILPQPSVSGIKKNLDY